MTKVDSPQGWRANSNHVLMSSLEASTHKTSTLCSETREDLLARIKDLEAAVVARDTFIAVAAHELRNPMMPILGQIDLLISGIRSEKFSLELVEERLGRVQQAARQFIKRAVVLLDVSRINSGRFRLEPVPCDLALLLRQISEDFAPAAQHSGVTLTVNAPENVSGLWDRLAIEQVIDNLLSNAIKYGGRSPVELGLIEENDVVNLHVRDHGKGIPREHRDRIFGRFERAVGHEEYRSGFGVGLWVVGQLVEAMQGTIAIDDAVGGGALFSVKLPKWKAEDFK
jgi:two-component system, OmpR family, sensor kinase